MKDEFFEVVFRTIDKDASGTIEKDEAMLFCK